MSEKDLRELHHALTQNWNLAKTETDRDQLRQALANRVAYLMRHNVQRLLTTMYLLDIPEVQFQQALARGETQASAEALADVIIDREHQKIASRRAHRRRTSIDTDIGNGDD